MIKKIIATLLIIHSCAWLSAQQTGKAIVYFEPTTAKVLLDGVPYACSRNPVTFAIGRHYVQAWDSTYIMYNDSFEVKPVGYAIVSKPLKHTKLYKKYKSELLSYNTKFFTYRYGLPILSVGYGSGLLIRHFTLSKKMDEKLLLANEAKEQYENALSVNDLSAYLYDYEQNKNEYDNLRLKHNKMLKIGAVALPVVSIGATYLCIYSKNLKRPVYKEKPPALFAFNAISINRQNEALCLNLNFSIR